MSENISTEELDLQEIEEYLNVAFSNGFSKGTANVSPHDMKKLAPLLKHYGKMAHPFRACVRDNRKRFGPLTEKYCAVLKDLIKGTTSWRSTERKKNLSEVEMNEFVLHWEDYPDNYIDEFVESLANLTEEDVKLLLSNDDNEENMTEVDLAAGDVAWSSDGGWNDIRSQLENELNDQSQMGGMDYWVVDVKGNEALVCEKGSDYYVVPFSVDKKGETTLSQESDWKPVEKAWVESNVNMSDFSEFVAELYFTDNKGNAADSDGLVWKTFMREGTWKFSPGSGKVVPKPLTIVKSGKSDPQKLVISMADIKKNFETGAIQHVTVPLSHEDKVNENTGFVKKMRFGKDDKGRTTLEAAIDFTEPDIKEKIDRGTIPNVSGGVHFNYIDKESGKKFTSVLGHLALTPKPWLGGMAPFGVKTSENLNVVGFSEEPQTTSDLDIEGGVEETMTTIVEQTFDETTDDNADTFLQELGLSEDEVKARLSRYDELEQEAKANRIDQKVRDWEGEKKSPALIAAAKDILMADEGAAVLNLSEEGKEVALTASDIVERLVEAAPTVALADDPITDKDAEGTAPPDDATEENLSDDIKSEARRLFLYERYSEDDAIAEAVRRSEEKTTA